MQSGTLKDIIVDRVDSMETTLAYLFPEMTANLAAPLLTVVYLFVLDEATANVDPENEDRLQKAIEALTRDKTIIMIAHRLKTVRHADKILVIDHGRIVQQGKHEQLIRENGIYAGFVGGKKRVGRLEAVNLQKRKQKRRRENKNVFAAFFFQFWVLLSDC